MENIILEHLQLFACPACLGHLRLEGDRMVCEQCSATYPIQDGIPRLFHPHGGVAERNGIEKQQDVTDIVKAFYEENPFPNYDDLDSRESLITKARRGVFARLMDEQIPQGALVLEAGCGTGQFSNFLGISWKRRVFGSDLCLNSLRLAKGFKDKNKIQNAAFLQMNLFRPAFQENSFDVVISNGVLHHTGDPLGGFRSISRLVKPGGVIVIGLYHKIGRLTTDARRVVFNAFGDRFRFLDAHMRNRDYNEARKRAWFKRIPIPLQYPEDRFRRVLRKRAPVCGPRKGYPF
jgi:SAM-dependent methyltransferase